MPYKDKAMKLRFLALAVLLLAIGAIPAKAQLVEYYVTTAVNAVGDESVFSNEVSATIPQGNHMVTLTWTDADTTVVSYNVYRGKVSGGPYVRINPAPVTVQTFIDTFQAPQTPVLAAPTVT